MQCFEPKNFLLFQLRTFKVGFSGPKLSEAFEKRTPGGDIAHLVRVMDPDRINIIGGNMVTEK